MAILLRTDGTQEDVVPAEPELGFSLVELHTLIGTDVVEVVYLNDEYEMWLDEEGKIKDKAPNWLAQGAAEFYLKGTGRSLLPGDFLVGDCLLTKRGEVK